MPIDDKPMYENLSTFIFPTRTHLTVRGKIHSVNSMWLPAYDGLIWIQICSTTSEMPTKASTKSSTNIKKKVYVCVCLFVCVR